MPHMFFECSVRYDKMQQNGSVKKVTEKYIVDALSFTEAEARIIATITPYISGEYTIPAIKKTKIAEIFRTSQVCLALGKSKSDAEKAIARKSVKDLERSTSVDAIFEQQDSRWFLVKVAFITIDQKTSVEKTVSISDTRRVHGCRSCARTFQRGHERHYGRLRHRVYCRHKVYGCIHVHRFCQR